MDNVKGGVALVVVVEDLKPSSSTPQPYSSISRGIQSDSYTTAKELLWTEEKAKLFVCSDI